MSQEDYLRGVRDATDEARRIHKIERPTNGEAGVLRRLMILGAVVSLAVTLVMVGYNFKQVTDDAAVLAKAPDTYQTKAVADVQYANLVGQLDVQRHQLEQLQASVNELLRNRKE